MNVRLKWLFVLLVVVCIPSGVVKGQEDDHPDPSTLDWLISNEENSVGGVFDIHDLGNTPMGTILGWRYGGALKHVRGLHGYPGRQLCGDPSLKQRRENDTTTASNDVELRYIAVVKQGEGTTLISRNLVKNVGGERATVHTVIRACSELLELEKKLNDDNRLGEWYFAIGRQFPGIEASHKFWTKDKNVKAALRAGWAYLGRRYGDRWTERHFIWDGNSPKPKKGYTLYATGSVNFRADHIRIDASSGGFVNAEKVGLIRKGDKLKVLHDPKVVENDFFWVHVVPVQ